MTDQDRLPEIRERLREVEAGWDRVREELTNAKLANANLGQRLGLKLDELKVQDAEILRLRGRLKELALSASYETCPGCGQGRPGDEVIQHGPDCWVVEATLY